LRVDTGFDIGDTFPDAYDSLVRKVIAHGQNRDEALSALDAYLSADVTTGIATNTGYLGRLIGRSSFRSGAVHTGLLEDEGNDLIKLPLEHPRLAGLAAIGVQLAREDLAKTNPLPFSSADGWRLNAEPSIVVRFGLPSGVLTARVESDSFQMSARISGDHAVVGRHLVQVERQGDRHHILLGNASPSTQAVVIVDVVGAHVIENGEVWAYPFVVSDMAPDALDAVDDIKATLPGKIALVNFEAGSSVVKGEVVVVLEAMKMEHSLIATRDGTIGEVLVREGRQVRAGDVLVRLVPLDDSK
jgi:3-methylcrotonyl-CoA carboxylase alpha subunit